MMMMMMIMMLVMFLMFFMVIMIQIDNGCGNDSMMFHVS